jgi:aminopeptidase YwaD
MMLAGQIGTRLAATGGERAAADYISNQFRADGYQVDLQPFPIKTFVSRSVSVVIVGTPDESLRAAPLSYSPPGQAEAEIVPAGLGYPGDYPAGGIGGRIALVQRGELTFGDKIRNAAAAGASAVLVYEPGKDSVPGTITGDIPAIPMLSISGADGVRLRDAAKSGPVRVRLAFDGGVTDQTANNVIAHTEGKPCSVIVGGHYDTVAGTQGASDNATGTAVTLELARLQAQRGNPEQACFIAFSGEEEGLLGSQYYVEHLSDADRKAIHFMLNFDMEAVGDEWLVIGSRDLQAKGKSIAAGMGIPARDSQLVGASSDYAAFRDRGIQALLLHRAEDSLLHTPQDRVERITAPPLDQAVRLGLAFLTGFGAS